MNHYLNNALLSTSAAVACTFFSLGVHAQAFPSKPITIVVPYAAGGATDITTRRLGEVLSKVLSVPVLVDNKPGAATIVGATFVARAPKDGYTLLMAPGTTTSINPYLYSKLSYKLEDFAPVSLVSRQGFALTAAASLPANNLTEFVAWAKKKGVPVSYGTTGTGSLTNILGEWIGRTLDIKLTEVPYKGTAASYPDLVSGRIDFNIEGMSGAIAHHTEGKRVKVLGVMTEERVPQMPDVGTTKEAGYSKLIAYTNFGLLAPQGTPKDVIEKLHAGVVKAVSDPDFVAKLAAGGEQAISSKSPQQFSEFLKSEYVHWGEIVKPMKLKLD